VDNYSRADNSLGAGSREQLYNGGIYPYPSGDCRYFCAFPNHPGPENFVIKSAKISADQEGNGRIKLLIKLKIKKFAEL
jgi:hypothetical protein